MFSLQDDIRLDARMMEFNSIINLYLHRDPEARNRGLHIRTYVSINLIKYGSISCH